MARVKKGVNALKTRFGTITTGSDLTATISPNMRIQFTQSAAVLYGVVTAITGSLITVYFGPNYTLTASAISLPYFSGIYAPANFPQNLIKFNPVKFRVYLSSAQNTSSGSFTPVLCDAKNYDTSSNVDIVTHKGRFTALVPGSYQFNGALGASLNGSSQLSIMLFKNGSAVSQGNQLSTTAASNGIPTYITVSDEIQLAANDYVEMEVFCNGTVALITGSSAGYFSGFQVSET